PTSSQPSAQANVPPAQPPPRLAKRPSTSDSPPIPIRSSPAAPASKTPAHPPSSNVGQASRLSLRNRQASRLSLPLPPFQRGTGQAADLLQRETGETPVLLLTPAP